jgi:hypothetical protein
MDTPVDPAEDPHPWRAAVALGFLAIAVGMLTAMWVAPLLGHNHWWIPGDAWRSLRAAHYVSQGNYGLIYETGSLRDIYDSGPLFPLVLAPVAAVNDLFHLHESYPFTRQHPSGWLTYGPYALATAIPLLYAVRALVTQLGVRTGRTVLQFLVLVLAFAPMAIIYGHYEDVIALTLLLLAFRDLFAGRGLRGALLVGVAIAFKQWSLLAVPVFVVACPPVVRVRAAARCLVPPAVVFSLFLAADYTYASEALLHPPAFPLYGHAALWVSSSTEYLSDVPTRFGAFVVAVVVAALVRNRRDPGLIVSALGVVLFCRFLFEPAVHAYYLAPGIAFLVVGERIQGGRVVTKVILSAALLLAFPFHPNRELWWLGAYALSFALLRKPVWRLLRRPAVVDEAPAAPGSGVARLSHA